MLDYSVAGTSCHCRSFIAWFGITRVSNCESMSVVSGAVEGLSLVLSISKPVGTVSSAVGL